MSKAFKTPAGIIVRHCEKRGWIIEIPVSYRERPAVLIAESEEAALAVAQHLENIKFSISKPN